MAALPNIGGAIHSLFAPGPIPSLEQIGQQHPGPFAHWRFLATFLRPVFSASREQHISDLHSKFALGPRHV